MDLIQEFTALLGASAVLSSQQDKAGHLSDWRGRYQGQAQCVVFPSTTEQVSAVANSYLERRQLVTLDSQQTALAQVDRFSRTTTVHGSGLSAAAGLRRRGILPRVSSITWSI